MSKMRDFKTTKGTDLPIMNLRGKEYLEVRYRVVWFREERPEWSIETEMINVTDNSAYAKATIRDQDGRIRATGHKFESLKGFPDFIEKSETGAIGRALALIGYGTQFCADELDEGERIVDAPVETQKKPALAAVSSKAVEIMTSDPLPLGDYLVPFGKHHGRKLRDIDSVELGGYLNWLWKLNKSGEKLDPRAKELFETATAYLKETGY